MKWAEKLNFSSNWTKNYRKDRNVRLLTARRDACHTTKYVATTVAGSKNYKNERNIPPEQQMQEKFLYVILNIEFD